MTGLTILRPTAARLVFLVEWLLFMLLALWQGKLESGKQILVASCPLAFFYSIACAFALLGEQSQQLARGWRLFALAVGLTAADQLAKTLIVASIPYRASVPIIDSWLHLAHVRNVHGSWVLSILNAQGAATVLLMIVVPLTLLFSVLCHRYYTCTQRRSVWADVAFVGLFGGGMSWVCDMHFRGYVVDFLVLPGVLAADLKDLFVTIGAAAFCAEALDNPNVSLRPKGWRQDGKDLLQLVARVTDFSVQELHGLWRTVVDRLVKDSGE
jgi:lipoprotein signal peptidase